MSIDPRDLFISLNPLGLDERELKKDSSGFADDRTHSDYLVFLAGYKAGAVDGEEQECQRHRPINAEGYKPEINTLLPGMPCAGGAGEHNLNQAEACKPDLSNRLIQAVTALIPYAEDEAANSYCEENADKAWAAVDFARALLDEIDSKKSIGEHA